MKENKSIKRLAMAIKAGRFNYKNYLCGGIWYGHNLQTGPLFCSYGQIGYTATLDGNRISYDWEFDKITLN